MYRLSHLDILSSKNPCSVFLLIRWYVMLCDGLSIDGTDLMDIVNFTTCSLFHLFMPKLNFLFSLFIEFHKLRSFFFIINPLQSLVATLPTFLLNLESIPVSIIETWIILNFRVFIYKSKDIILPIRIFLPSLLLLSLPNFALHP